MKQYPLFVFLILCLTGLSIAAANTGTPSIRDNFKDYTADVSMACEAIIDVLKAIDGMHVTRADGIVKDHKTGLATIGCLAYVTGNINKNKRGKYPHDTLRKAMESNAWREDISRAGDGPSSTTYSLYREEAMCTISAFWGLPSNGERTQSFEDQYELEAQCMKLPANKAL